MNDAEDYVEAAASEAMMQLAIELNRRPKKVGVAMITAGLKSLMAAVGVTQTQALIRSLAPTCPRLSK